jgi:UDP-glucose 4-epimerase
VKNKSILVTGGAGFIGSSLIRTLVNENEVFSLDNYFTGSEKNHVEGATYLRGDTRNISEFRSRLPKIDLLYHFGEYSRVEQSFADVNRVWSYNVEGTKKVFDFVRDTATKIVYSGSSTKFAAKTQDYVMSPYAWTKSTNTDLIKQYRDWYGIDYAITYFYNVYGPGELSTGSYATLIGKYHEIAKTSKIYPVVSPGTQSRTFTHIDDTVDALIRVGNDGSGDYYGIAAVHSHSVLDVAYMFIEKFGGKVEMIPPRQGNRMSAEVVTARTRDLGWSPKIKLPIYVKGLE